MVDKKKVKKKPVVMMMDTREKDVELKGYLQKFGTHLNEVHLEVGDIIIPGNKRTFVIEHKSVSDLGNSIRDGRLFKQIKDLVDGSEVENQEYQPAILLIGNVFKLWKINGFNEWQIAALLNSIQFAWGVQIIYAHNNFFGAIRLISLARKYQLENDEKKLFPMRFGTKRKMSKEEELQYILEGFPMISCTRAKKIMEEYATLGEALDAMREGKIDEIHGIGEKISSVVADVFEYEI